MSSVAEVVAAARAVVSDIAETQAILVSARERVVAANQSANVVFQGTGHEAVIEAQAVLSVVEENITGEIQRLEDAIEQLQAYVAAL